jgi:hypothetical protein
MCTSDHIARDGGLTYTRVLVLFLSVIITIRSAVEDLLQVHANDQYDIWSV